jgi:hypothetical protein
MHGFTHHATARAAVQAVEFFDEVGGGSPRSAGGGGGQWGQRALGKLQRFHRLKDEPSIRRAMVPSII